ncbi:hypothetical protein BB558_000584 [Smittium angustum]|uniref:MYND-type domain-containing protein n=1 Tax=Smittium angustum TaxID=133377 RepID=A0A2U1JDX6_SMIAN|nr:hypothetical protein BB558_000584 [Smittium angustum]
MRESNFNFPLANKACVSISSSLYDRRALDCTSVLPLVNSLYNLGILTFSSARIREIMTTDGGLERLVRILKTTKISKGPKDALQNWKWLTAYHCIINMGVRGTEEVRTRVVQAGAVSVFVCILEAYLKKMEVVDLGKKINQIKNITNDCEPTKKNSFSFQRNQTGNPIINTSYDRNNFNDQNFGQNPPAAVESPIQQNINNNQRGLNILFDRQPNFNTANTATTNLNRVPNFESPNTPFNPENQPNNLSNLIIPERTFANTPEQNNNQARNFENVNIQRFSNAPSRTPLRNISYPIEERALTDELSFSSLTAIAGRSHTDNRVLSNDPYGHSRLEVMQMQYQQAELELQQIDDVMFRPEDLVLSLQLLAYVTKYSDIRRLLYSVTVSSSNKTTPDGRPARRVVNVFELVEQFTCRNNSHYMQGWADIIMGNMCRKDEKRGGIKKCANIHCNNWETIGKQFARCKRCRKAKYCSKECQSEAWESGHKHWCSEKPGQYEYGENVASNVQPVVQPPPQQTTEQLLRSSVNTRNTYQQPVLNQNAATQPSRLTRYNNSAPYPMTRTAHNGRQTTETRTTQFSTFNNTQQSQPMLNTTMINGQTTQLMRSQQLPQGLANPHTQSYSYGNNNPNIEPESLELPPVRLTPNGHTQPPILPPLAISRQHNQNFNRDTPTNAGSMLSQSINSPYMFSRETDASIAGGNVPPAVSVGDNNRRQNAAFGLSNNVGTSFEQLRGFQNSDARSPRFGSFGNNTRH